MAEKRSEKKWLVLLVILVALSLVVDLLSLNVLYSIAQESGLGGSLFSTFYYPRNEPTVYYTDYRDEAPSYASSSSVIDYYNDEDSDISYEEAYGCGMTRTTFADDCIGDCTYPFSVCLYDACVSKGICEEGCDLDFGCIWQCSFDRSLEELDCKTGWDNCIAQC